MDFTGKPLCTPVQRKDRSASQALPDGVRGGVHAAAIGSDGSRYGGADHGITLSAIFHWLERLPVQGRLKVRHRVAGVAMLGARAPPVETRRGESSATHAAARCSFGFTAIVFCLTVHRRPQVTAGADRINPR